MKGKNKICSGKVYGTLCTGIHNLPTRKKQRKTCVAQANSKVTFHNVTSLWVVYDLSTIYFKLMTFRFQWEDLHKIIDLFLKSHFSWQKLLFLIYAKLFPCAISNSEHRHPFSYFFSGEGAAVHRLVKLGLGLGWIPSWKQALITA